MNKPIDASLVTLREITSETVLPVIRLSVAENQKKFVAPNSVSLAQALFAPEAWYRAIYYSDEIVGFVMLEDESLRSPPPEKPVVFLWRLMVDSRFQGRGIGRAALLGVMEHVRAKGLFETLETSYVPGPDCPEPFYIALGFRHSGRVDEDGEIVLELPLRGGIDMSPSKGCPKCHHTFKRGDDWRFATWWGRRRVSNCPECGVHLTWAPTMWRLGNVSAVAVMGMSLAYLSLRDRLTFTPAWWLVDVSAAVLMVLAVYRRQLMTVPDGEEPRQLHPSG